MKILHTSDWHLGKTLYDFSLLDDQQYMIDQLLLLLEKERMDAVVLAGDIYDRPIPSAQAVQLYDHFLSEAVGRLGIPVLAIAGNHDSAGRLEFGSRLYRASGYHICGQVRKDIHRVTLTDSFGPVDFWLIPYQYPAEVRVLFPQESVRTFDDCYRVLLEHNLPQLDADRRNVAVAHGYFQNLAQPEELVTCDSEMAVGGMDIADIDHFSAFEYVALGHLHAPQCAGREHARYSGSPLKYSLSEEFQVKNHIVAELGPKGLVELTSRFIPALRDVRTIEGSLNQLLEPAFHENQQFDDYAFAQLRDEHALYPMEKLRRLFPHLLGLRLTGEKEGNMPEIQAGDAAPQFSPEEMFLQFYREVKGEEMPPEVREFFWQTVREEGREE